MSKPESGQPTAAGARVIDGTGKMLLPGLWDMHQHFFPDLAVFDIASGITTARDLANSIEDLGKLKKHIEQGEQVGPRCARGIHRRSRPVRRTGEGAGGHAGGGAPTRR